MEKFVISTGLNRTSKKWKRECYTWQNFIDRLKKPQVTNETVEEYFKMTKDEQAKIKDVGGFVGGKLNGERRKAENVEFRTLITLDVDFGANEFVEMLEMWGYKGFVYATHSYTPLKPKYRVIMPLSREVTADEYVAISRKIAASFGMDYFDDTTYEPSRLMYWPSTPRDMDYISHEFEGAVIDADEVLAKYKDWRDITEWPISSRENKRVKTNNNKLLQDPAVKTGLIGVFCKTYNIHEVISKYLSSEYKECAIPNRYTYVGGTTSAGLVVYDDKFAYSHHSTDPTSGISCNAYDLVRLHKFKDLADKESNAAMRELIIADTDCAKLVMNEKLQTAKTEFEEVVDEEPENDGWMREIKLSDTGKPKATINNLILIMKNDAELKDKIYYDEFLYRTLIKSDLPWRKVDANNEWKDADDSGLRYFFENKYDISGRDKIKDALNVVQELNRGHCVRDKLKSLKWDGIKRLETVLIDFLGAEDNVYTREVTKKHICAGIARVFEPGIKYDTMIVLLGAQGLGKSTLLNKLSLGWFCDAILDVNTKEAREQLIGSLYVEHQELVIKKAESDAFKRFITSQSDRFRPSYGRCAVTFPRQSIHWGSTNTYDFLSDTTGNRRYMPIKCYINKPTRHIFKDLDVHYAEQIQAEAYEIYNNGIELFLDSELEKLALVVQAEHLDEDPRVAMIEEFVDIPIPANWADLDIGTRRSFLKGCYKYDGPLVKRDRICAAILIVELFGEQENAITAHKSREINSFLRQLEGWKLYPHNDGKIKYKDYGKQRSFIRK